jgi:hypothetical protein
MSIFSLQIAQIFMLDGPECSEILVMIRSSAILKYKSCLLVTDAGFEGLRKIKLKIKHAQIYVK